MVELIVNGHFWSTSHEYAKSDQIDASSVEQELDDVTHVVVSPTFIYRVNHEYHAL